MLVLKYLFISLFLFTTQTYPAFSASFDCKKASAPVEILICSDPELSEIDAKLGNIYRLARKELSETEAAKVKQKQRQWIRQRNHKCPIKKQDMIFSEKRVNRIQCLIQQTNERISEFSVIAGRNKRDSIPLSVARAGLILGHSLKEYDISVPPMIESRELKNKSFEVFLSKGHEGQVFSAAFNHDGTMLVTGGADNTVHIWDPKTRQEISVLGSHRTTVHSVAFSSDGARVFSGDADGYIKVWDLSDFSEIRELGRFQGIITDIVPVGIHALVGIGKVEDTSHITNRDVSNRQDVVFVDLFTGEIGPPPINIKGINKKMVLPDGHFLVTSSVDLNQQTTNTLWDIKTWKALKTYKSNLFFDSIVAVSHDSNFIAIAKKDNVSLINLQKDQIETLNLPGKPNWIPSLAFSGDKTTLIISGYHGKVFFYNILNKQWRQEQWLWPKMIVNIFVSYNEFIVWTDSGGERSYNLIIKISSLINNRIIKQGELIGKAQKVSWSVPIGENHVGFHVAHSSEKIWNLKTGRVETVESQPTHKNSRLFAYDVKNDKKIYASDNGYKVTLKNTKSKLNKFLINQKPDALYCGSVGCSGVYDVGFSADGRWAAVTADSPNFIRVWRTADWKEISLNIDQLEPRMEGYINGNGFQSLDFSSDGRLLALAHIPHNRIIVLDMDNGNATAYKFKDIIPKHLVFEPKTHHLYVNNRLLFDVDKKLVIRSGKVLPAIPFKFLADGSKGISNGDYSVKAWSRDKNGHWSLLATTFPIGESDWVSLTPQGFYDGSEKGVESLTVRIENTVQSIEQFHEVLYRPDLLIENLSGDSNHLVNLASNTINLEKIAANGPPPIVRITTPASVVNKTDSKEILINAEVYDHGGGIGKIEWYVNGVKLPEPMDDTRGLYRLEENNNLIPISRLIPLSSGINTISVAALNKVNQIRSSLSDIDVFYEGNEEYRPNLYILTVGIDNYQDRSLHLKFAAQDALTIARTLKSNAGNLFNKIDVSVLMDKQVTYSGLKKAFEKISKNAAPDDMFIFFLAGHGVAQNGTYYFIPQDFRYINDKSLSQHAIDQDSLNHLLTSIPARKSLILLDTCDSGSFAVKGLAQRGFALKTAINRLMHSSGRSTIAAASEIQPALEGYKGHGLFTYAILEALTNQSGVDLNKNHSLEVLELAAFVTDRVSEISSESFGFEQVPQYSLFGHNFPFALFESQLP